MSIEDKEGFSFEHFAIAGGSIPIIFFLIEHQFPLDNCVQCSIYFHRNDLIDLFVAASPSKFLNPTAIVNSSADVWETPLFQSCHTNNVEVFLQMLNYNDISSMRATILSLADQYEELHNSNVKLQNDCKQIKEFIDNQVQQIREIHKNFEKLI